MGILKILLAIVGGVIAVGVLIFGTAFAGMIAIFGALCSAFVVGFCIVVAIFAKPDKKKPPY